jgi:hypothetical protein
MIQDGITNHRTHECLCEMRRISARQIEQSSLLYTRGKTRVIGVRAREDWQEARCYTDSFTLGLA